MLIALLLIGEKNMFKKITQTEPLLNIHEVARLLDMAPTTIYKMASHRRIHYVKVGGALKFDPVKLQEWIKA